jgi:hypothetical protein
MSPDALTGLRAYHLPDAMHWWPPAPGWWLLAVLAALAAGLLWRRRRRRRQRTRASLLAQRELQGLRVRWEADADDTAFVRALAALIRRYAIARWPGDDVAGLTGARWRSYLAAKCAHAPAPVREALDADLGEAITLAPYRRSTALDAGALADAAAALIRHGADGPDGGQA